MSRLPPSHMAAVKAASSHSRLPPLKPHVPRPPWAPVQRRATGAPPPAADVPNRTGLPDRLKAGVEALSGLSMDDVRVHRNSSEPAKLDALAYAKGSDIHLGPGQERHLPHEAWHVVQQKQRRVGATAQMKDGQALNDDPALESEADRKGVEAARTVLAPATMRLTATPPQPSSPIAQAFKRQNTNTDLAVTPNGSFYTHHINPVTNLTSRRAAFGARNPQVTTNTTATLDAWRTAMNANTAQVGVNENTRNDNFSINVVGFDTTATADGVAAIPKPVGFYVMRGSGTPRIELTHVG